MGGGKLVLLRDKDSSVYDIGILLMGIGFAVLLFAPYGLQVWGIFALMFSAMLIWSSGYNKEEKK